MKAASFSMLALALTFSCAHAAEAEEPSTSVSASMSMERHWTSNALESEIELPDWYSLLRGAVEAALPHDGGRIVLGAAIEAKTFDSLSILDDSSLVLSAGAEHRVGTRLELRGALSWKLASEGDHLVVEDLLIGTRTVTETVSVALQAGLDLGGGYALIVDAGAGRETPRPTRFEANAIEPLLLMPDKDRLELSAMLRGTAGQWTGAAFAGGELILAGRRPTAPFSFTLVRHRAGVQAEWTMPDGLRLRGAVGLEQLSALDGAISELRPIYELAASAPLRGGIELTARLSGGFDTRHADDPVASWLERREVEARIPLSEKLAFASGLFSSFRRNLSLAFEENAQGVYAELSYRLSEPVTVVLRLDASESRYTAPETIVRKLDAFVGLRAGI